MCLVCVTDSLEINLYCMFRLFSVSCYYSIDKARDCVQILMVTSFFSCARFFVALRTSVELISFNGLDS